jgi:hypothetical protein
MVSGSISLPYSGFFSPFPHGTSSLSVSQEYLALADGPAGFIQGFTCPALLRIPLSYCPLPIPGYHRLWLLFPKYSSSPQYCRNNIGLGCSDFARRYYRNHFCFLFLRVLRCFSSPGLPPCGYYIFNIVGCPIRKSSDQRVCAPPRSLSQLITSFIVSESLGIPHTLLICLLYFFAL